MNSQDNMFHLKERRWKYREITKNNLYTSSDKEHKTQIAQPKAIEGRRFVAMVLKDYSISTF